jgi:hypothetical protein
LRLTGASHHHGGSVGTYGCSVSRVHDEILPTTELRYETREVVSFDGCAAVSKRGDENSRFACLDSIVSACLGLAVSLSTKLANSVQSRPSTG